MGLCALVTGASAGLGAEFARQLAGKGIDLILSARNTQKLDGLKFQLESKYPVKVVIITADLSVPGSGRALFAECENLGLEVDILINNAGMGMFGETVDQDTDRIEGLLCLNMVSLTTLSGLFAASMATRGGGHILNVGSMAGNQATPFFASYAASKGYVHRFTLALRHELKSKNVHVTCLQPGYIKTGFDKNAQIKNQRYLSVSEKNALSAERVAKIGLRGMFNNRGNIIAGWTNTAAYHLGKLVPEPLKSAGLRAVVAKLTQ